ncbi:MAG: hypothetical protein ONB48_09620 [candidate division KSB1 bacterium]|nr:hypothetical protein [candidate division KSB1 bacterium]MDZ7273745.1 hypothetical protein [candidate division KSB1 bacterium]MDZ7285901.1 hypothetical protein [candidate division KSB1 bacterium]MDZ7298933.1 hypothetical protein [candidate division KSB1 bacterium]MDZ7307608.1 hypothetical protein [candidate division KSB1 bacterium]
MSRKFLPAKIIVNRGIEAQTFHHPRAHLFHRLSVVLGVLTLAGWLALTLAFPRVLAAVYTSLLPAGVIVWLMLRLRYARLQTGAVRVSEENFPEIHYIHHAVARALPGIADFAIYVTAEARPPRWQATGGQRVLVLSQAQVAAMIGRPQIGQLIWLVSRMLALQWLRRQSWPITRLLVLVARCNPLSWAVVNYYCSLTHLTADRLGLGLGLSLIDAVEAMKTMCAGALAGRVNSGQIERQPLEQRHRLAEWCNAILTAQPGLLRRLAELVAFGCERFPDLYADLELHRKYERELLPSFREIQQFSEGKEEERRLQREIGNLVYDAMSVQPPAGEADSISRAFLKLQRNRQAATDLESKISRLNLAKLAWEKTVAAIAAAEQKRENATRALETHYRELGRTAFKCLQPHLGTDAVLKQIFEKALQYQVVISDRENEIARLEAASGSVLDKSKRQMEILALRTQNSTDARRLQAAAEAVGEEFWKTCAERYEHDDLEPIKLRITGVIAELERRRLELENLHQQKRQYEHDLEKEGLESAARPEVDVPFLIEQLKNEARAANALRPRLLEELGKAYWQNEPSPAPEIAGLIEQLNDLKKRLRDFEQDEV